MVNRILAKITTILHSDLEIAYYVYFIYHRKNDFDPGY